MSATRQPLLTEVGKGSYREQCLAPELSVHMAEAPVEACQDWHVGILGDSNTSVVGVEDLPIEQGQKGGVSAIPTLPFPLYHPRGGQKSLRK